MGPQPQHPLVVATLRRFGLGFWNSRGNDLGFSGRLSAWARRSSPTMPRNLAHEAKKSPLAFHCRRRADPDGPMEARGVSKSVTS
jgi:hypothetical protein